MKRSLLGITLWLASCGGSRPIPVAPQPAPKVLPANELEAIAGLVEQYRQGYEVASVDALAVLYAQDLDLTLVYQGREYRGWTAAKAFLVKKLGGARSGRMAMKDVSIRVLGSSSAVVTATRESSIGDGAVTVTERGVLSLVLQRREQRWKVVSEHFSYVAGRR